MTDSQGFAIISRALDNTCINIDCNYCTAHTVSKVIACNTAATSFVFVQGPANDTGSLRPASCSTSCLNGGQGPSNPPCKGGESYLPQGQLQLVDCSDPSASNVWQVLSVAIDF